MHNSSGRPWLFGGADTRQHKFPDQVNSMIDPLSWPASVARLGMVSFLNTAPLYETWTKTVINPEWRAREAPPTVLNRLLFAGELDLAMISSQEYAIHPASYRILSGLAIAATGSVDSVFLFSRYPLRDLHNRLILLSSRSQTSVSLVKIILEDFYGLQPRYLVGDEMARSMGEGVNAAGDYDAALSIGDAALCLAAAGDYAYSFDLAKIWYDHTGLPFVFAIWAVREDFWRAHPATVTAIHGQLKNCLRQGLANLDEICRLAAPRVPMTRGACRRYLSGMEYDLNLQHQAGLIRFFEMLIRRGEAPTTALPLKII